MSLCATGVHRAQKLDSCVHRCPSSSFQGETTMGGTSTGIRTWRESFRATFWCAWVNRFIRGDQIGYFPSWRRGNATDPECMGSLRASLCVPTLTPPHFVLRLSFFWVGRQLRTTRLDTPSNTVNTPFGTKCRSFASPPNLSLGTAFMIHHNGVTRRTSFGVVTKATA